MDECKTCRHCGEAKPLTSFSRASRSSDGRRNSCKTCDVAANRAREEKRRGAPVPRNNSPAFTDEHGKTCQVCEQHKPFGEFYRQQDGRPSSECKDCTKARMRAVRAPHLTRAPKSFRDDDGKVCPKCQDYKRYELFKRPRSGQIGTYCRACALTLDRAAKARNREEMNRVRRERWPVPPEDPGELRRCPRCTEEKPLSTFGPGGKRGYCDPCRVDYAREHHRKHRDRYREERYGLSLDQFLALLDRQSGGCAICGTTEITTGRRVSNDGRDLHVDHDHDTGAVRGLLCNRCNVTLGLMDDDPERLIRAADYLKNPPALR